MPYIAKARLCYEDKVKYPDSSRAVLIIWELPHATQDRPHGYKYRMNYSTADGTTIFRLDNKSGKGDHMHVYEKEFRYTFTSIDVLISDFWQTVRFYRERR